MGEIVLQTELANHHEPRLCGDCGIIEYIPCMVAQDVLLGESADHAKVRQLTKVKTSRAWKTSTQKVNHRPWCPGKKALDIRDHFLVIIINQFFFCFGQDKSREPREEHRETIRGFYTEPSCGVATMATC